MHNGGRWGGAGEGAVLKLNGGSLFKLFKMGGGLILRLENIRYPVDDK